MEELAAWNAREWCILTPLWALNIELTYLQGLGKKIMLTPSLLTSSMCRLEETKALWPKMDPAEASTKLLGKWPGYYIPWISR